ncbi:glycosyltransferase family 61 protein [Acanthopleuribacter pedis]|uniref:Glycosyltransferase family 61 protein n=1 Tax=Acanthopleuribacter pedis TaxID=442870 RepID=A0A8J7Q2B3_9BACT|nr:glycosyltransferase family 61 protein [Acanthopleuribacter pedis]MBO1319222.1 glycosyltransferase family 61 protein [Acanthopleuribacter pedis]
MLASAFYRMKRVYQKKQRLFTNPVRVLHGRERAWRAPAVFLPEQLGKVQAVQEETTLTFEQARIFGGEVEHGATEVYHLHNAKVVNGYIYSDEGRVVVTPQRERGLALRTGLRVEKALLASSYNGNRYFGHWLSDDCTRALIGDVYGPPLFTGTRWTAHQHDYRRMLGIEAPPTEVVLVETLSVIPDVGQNAFKRQRLKMIREKMRLYPGQRCGHGVFITRGTSGRRRLLRNEQQVADHLARYGFDIVDPTKESLTQMMHKIKDAALVVGVEGSHLVHGVFAMAQGGALLTLQPPNRFNNVLKDLTDALGNRYGFVVGDARGDDFEIDINAMMMTLDLMSQQMSPATVEIA